MSMEQDQVHHAQDNSSLPETNIRQQQTFHSSSDLVHAVPVTFQANPAFNLNTDAAVPAPISLNLSLSSSFNLYEHSSNSSHSAFAMMPSFGDGDSNSSIIRVA